MRLLLTGGTGFVGHAVLDALLAEGHRVRVLARRPLTVRDTGPAGGESPPEVAAGNILDPPSLEKAMAGLEGVVHLVGIISEAGSATFENVHTQGTANVVEAARKSGATRFVHMSALGTRPGAVSRYHRTKWAAEEYIRNSGLAWTIFRPSLIYGPEDHFVNLFARIARYSPIVPVLGSGQARFQPIDVASVASAFARATTCPQAVGQCFDLCGPDRLTLRQIIEETLAALGRRRLLVTVPGPLAQLQAGILRVLVAGLLRKPPPLNRDQLIMLNEDTQGNPRPANQLFGLAPPGFRAGIRAYLGRSHSTPPPRAAA